MRQMCRLTGRYFQLDTDLQPFCLKPMVGNFALRRGFLFQLLHREPFYSVQCSKSLLDAYSTGKTLGFPFSNVLVSYIEIAYQNLISRQVVCNYKSRDLWIKNPMQHTHVLLNYWAEICCEMDCHHGLI
jgi:hypothetical protein